jgi:hypothetical protein
MCLSATCSFDSNNNLVEGSCTVNDYTIDNCPSDPNKINPGICGCGVSDVDSDGDGTPDCKSNIEQFTRKDQGFNFVAGDETTCTNSVHSSKWFSSFPINIKCLSGGGCGLSCGIPNGTSCLSANPQHPGMCLSATCSFDSNNNLVEGSCTVNDYTK